MDSSPGLHPLFLKKKEATIRAVANRKIFDILLRLCFIIVLKDPLER